MKQIPNNAYIVSVNSASDYQLLKNVLRSNEFSHYRILKVDGFVKSYQVYLECEHTRLTYFNNLVRELIPHLSLTDVIRIDTDRNVYEVRHGLEEKIGVLKSRDFGDTNEEPFTFFLDENEPSLLWFVDEK